MLRSLLVLLRGFFGRCPRCGKGRVFAGFYALNSTCSVCGTPFHHDGSPTVGAMIINMFVTILIGFIGAIPLVINTAPDQLMLAVALWLLVLIVFAVIFYRFARGLWVSITTLTGALEQDEVGRDDSYANK
ncbi:MAG: DUF983 domain-containing protein [Herpetosiphon sp.]|nr:DUF983 domain-containing protein [Herpetosiphon sp.]